MVTTRGGQSFWWIEILPKKYTEGGLWNYWWIWVTNSLAKKTWKKNIWKYQNVLKCCFEITFKMFCLTQTIVFHFVEKKQKKIPSWFEIIFFFQIFCFNHQTNKQKIVCSALIRGDLNLSWWPRDERSYDQDFQTRFMTLHAQLETPSRELVCRMRQPTSL